MEAEWLLLAVWWQGEVGNIFKATPMALKKQEIIMDFFTYLISGFLIAKFYFAKSKVQKILLGAACLVVSLVINYQANREFGWGMFFHVAGAFLILIALDYISKIKNR